MRTAGAQLVVAAFVPVPASPVGVESDDFHAVDVHAECGATKLGLEAAERPQVHGNVARLAQGADHYPAQIGLAVNHSSHSKNPPWITMRSGGQSTDHLLHV